MFSRSLPRALVTVFLLAVPSIALAQESVLPLVSSVVENSAATQITVSGVGFGAAKPQVTLSGVSLAVVSSSDTSITAAVPAGLAPGSYLLVVTNSRTRLPGLFAASIGLEQAAQGPAGPQGPAGSVGPAGPMGLQGTAGAQGPAGAAGAVGPAGTTGPVGPSGQAGATGPTGPAGTMGLAGPAGSTGAIGPQGAVGATGPQGLPGAPGPQGSLGPPGAPGPVGPPGMVGAPGMQGAVGPTGATGPAGSRGPIGASIQSWSSNNQLPATLVANSFLIGSPLGFGPAQDVAQGALVSSVVLAVPQACSASNFTVHVLGARGQSSAYITLGAASQQQVADNSLGTVVSCELTANAGNPVSCTASGPGSIPEGSFLSIVVQGFTNPSDFAGSNVLVDYQCQ